MDTVKLCTPLILSFALLAQEFDVATIKPTAAGAIVKGFFFLPGGGLETKNATLKDLVVLAYDVLPNQIQGGPPWITADRYDVDAKPVTEAEGDPATLTPAERLKWRDRIRLRTRALLASRFHLAVHKETREFAMYELHVDRNGPKADAMKETGANLGISFRGNAAFSNGGDMRDLALTLQSVVKEPVIDKTELTGAYSFTLRWSADPLSGFPGNADQTALPSIFTALREQLGLRLDSTRGPLDVIVIDRAEKPSDN
jgi:uncharacterized protein (TIGR03435 family)